MSKIKSIESRFWEKVEKTDGCWKWTARRDRKGYGCIKHNGNSTLAHRVSWELHNGPIPAGLHVLHKCDNPECTNPEHLFLGTNQENVDDKMRKGRLRPSRGELNGKAKLTSDQVKEIREIGKTVTQVKLAQKYGVSQVNISEILLRRTWRCL